VANELRAKFDAEIQHVDPEELITLIKYCNVFYNNVRRRQDDIKRVEAIGKLASQKCDKIISQMQSHGSQEELDQSLLTMYAMGKFMRYASCHISLFLRLEVSNRFNLP